MRMNGSDQGVRWLGRVMGRSLIALIVVALIGSACTASTEPTMTTTSSTAPSQTPTPAPTSPTTAPPVSTTTLPLEPLGVCPAIWTGAWIPFKMDELNAYGADRPDTWGGWWIQGSDGAGPVVVWVTDDPANHGGVQGIAQPARDEAHADEHGVVGNPHGVELFG